MEHKGNLNCNEYDQEYLDRVTSVGGDVWAEGSREISLPVCTAVGGYVWASGSCEISLPVCTAVGGYVGAEGSCEISLPVCTSIQGEVFEPGQLTLLRCGPWVAVITPGYLRIGCQRHTHAQWLAFTDEEIAQMDSAAAETAKAMREVLVRLLGKGGGGQ
jgi:hypothetical protein